jgi:23S rRNA (pseudouridine1915-N3)-methyltransferase
VDGRRPGAGGGEALKLRVLAVGKLKDEGLRALCDDYRTRIRRYAPCEELEVKDGAALGAKVGKGAFLVALDPRGEELTSSQLAQRLSRWLGLGRSEIAFVIGGADGLPRELMEKADAKLSLSRMTLPHRIARLVLFEQLYRAFSILRNEPYARED